MSKTIPDTPKSNIYSIMRHLIVIKEYHEPFLHSLQMDTQITSNKVLFSPLPMQVLLQRLNYLSPIHKLYGCYDDITMAAVKQFQVHCMSK